MIVKINLIEVNKYKIKELENSTAFTGEGMTLDKENLEGIAEVFIEEELVKPDTKEIDGYFWYGKLMNDVYNLHGENRYSDDLPFLCFENTAFDGNGNLNVFKLMVGARWLDDIVANNAIRED